MAEPNYNLCRDCYYQLRQLRVISRALTSTATAVHAFVTSRLDYCSTLYVGLPAVRMGCIERVIRTAARLIGGIPRTGHVSAYMLDVLHWLPSSSGSCSVLVPWSGGVSWVLLRLTSEIFAIPPRAPEDAVHSDHPNRGYSLFLLLVHPQPRPVHSRWLVPLCGMGFRCRKDCFPGFSLTHSTLLSKLFFLAVQGSGALLSSNLEGALYKTQ